MAKITSIPKKMTRFNWQTVGAVVVGMVVFGGIVYGISRLPNNAVTTPVKRATANIA